MSETKSNPDRWVTKPDGVEPMGSYRRSETNASDADKKAAERLRQIEGGELPSEDDEP